jgi:hypothetical protein
MPKMPSHLDARHVWLCPDPAAQRIRNAGINSLAQWMHSSLTSPDIQLVVTTRLGQLFSNLPFTPIPSLADDAQAALLTQDSIGWANFFEGCIAQEWEAIQEAYFHWCWSQKTGRRWMASLIQKLWDISWDLWEHRIGIVHDHKNEAILYMTAVDQEIRTQFHRSPHGLHSWDQQLFAGTLQDILGASIFYRQRWLHRAETARARASQRVVTTYSMERQALRAWLQSSSTAQS